MPSDFPLGRRVDDSSMFNLPYTRRPEGVVIIGQNGMGKSGLIYRMAERDLLDNIGAIVIDPKGNLADKLKAVRPEKTILIEVKEDQPFGINPYEIVGDRTIRNIDRTVNNVVNLFRKVFGDHEFHPNIEMVVRVTARMIACNNLTMVEVPYIFGSKTFRNELMQNVNSRQVRNFWDHWDTLPAIEKSRLVQPLIARLNAFLDQEWLYRVLSQRKTTIPFDKVFKQGYTILIKLPREDEELTNFLGAVFVALLTQAVWRQNEVFEDERRRVHLYIDEYSAFAGSAATSMLFKQARDLEISTTAAMQVLSDIKDIAHREALMQAGTLIFFQLTGNDGEAVVNNLTIPPEEVKIDPRLFAITRDPFTHLVRFKHDHPVVEKVAEKIRLVEEILEHPQYKTERYHKQDTGNDSIWGMYVTTQGLTFLTNMGALRTGRDKFNRLLVQSMDDPGFIGSEDYFKQVCEAVLDLHSVIGFQVSTQKKRSALISDIQNPHAYRSCIAFMAFETADDSYINRMTANFRSFIENLERCCRALAKDPIRIPTGAIDIEQLGKQVKSFADRKGELANSLTHLPHYTAYVQTHGDDGVPREGTVRLTEPGYGFLTVEDLEALWINSEKYHQRWDEVEPEIEQRQARILTTLQTTPPKKQSPDEPETPPLMTRFEIFYPD